MIVQAFCIAVVGTSLMLFSFVLSSINIGLLGSVAVGLITNGVVALSIPLTIILLHKGFGLFSLAIKLVFVGISNTLCQGIYLIWRVRSENIGLSFTFKDVFVLAKLLSYTFLWRTSGIISNNIDLIITSRFIGPETVAVLALTRKAPDFSKELVNRPSVAFLPAVSHLAGAGEIDKARKVLTRLLRILLWMLCLVIGGLIAFNDDFVRLWVGSHLFAGQSLNLIITGTLFFTVASACLSNICFALGNIKGNSLAGLAQSLLFIPLVFWGTKYFGLLGTVLAPLIAVLSVSAWYYPRSFSKLIKLSSQDSKNIMHEVFFTLIVMVLLSLGFSSGSPENWLQFVALVAMFCFLYGCLIYAVSKDFRGEIGSVIQKLQSIWSLT